MHELLKADFWDSNLTYLMPWGTLAYHQSSVISHLIVFDNSILVQMITIRGCLILSTLKYLRFRIESDNEISFRFALALKVKGKQK